MSGRLIAPDAAMKRHAVQVIVIGLSAIRPELPADAVGGFLLDDVAPMGCGSVTIGSGDGDGRCRLDSRRQGSHRSGCKGQGDRLGRT